MDNLSAIEALDRYILDQASQIHTQQTAESSKDGIIEALQRKIAALQEQKDSLQAEFMKQSTEWKKIKEKLRQRQSLRAILGPTLTDGGDIPREPSPSAIVDLSEDSPTQEPSTMQEDGINLLADALEGESPVDQAQKENLPVAVDSGHGADCPCCSRFYQAICRDRDEIRERKVQVSRHKYRQDMPGTPPGFWNVGFTQK